MYRGEADWRAIARAADVVRGSGTLLLGNGDVQSLADGMRRIRETGVDGVLIGRAALGVPWFFRQKEATRCGADHANDDQGMQIWEPTLETRFEILLDHARRFETLSGRDQFRRMRKHLGWYCKGFPHAAALRARMFRVSSVAEVEQALTEYRATALAPAEECSVSHADHGTVAEPLLSRCN
jgi:tRNA-dihydrouridine synthase